MVIMAHLAPQEQRLGRSSDSLHHCVGMGYLVTRSELPEGEYCSRMPIRTVMSMKYSFRVTVVGSWISLLWLDPLWWPTGDTDI